eukprot:3154297-Ditylum_brightwellii.AAC.1
MKGFQWIFKDGSSCSIDKPKAVSVPPYGSASTVNNAIVKSITKGVRAREREGVAIQFWKSDHVTVITNRVATSIGDSQ